MVETIQNTSKVPTKVVARKAKELNVLTILSIKHAGPRSTKSVKALVVMEITMKFTDEEMNKYKRKG
jgi:hypothetical protein